MTLKALFYAYVLGGITFIPFVIAALVFFTIYTSVPVGDPDPTKKTRAKLEAAGAAGESTSDGDDPRVSTVETNDLPRTRKGWLTMRRTFEESAVDGGYVTYMRSFLDSRSKDPKRSRPKDMWYVVLKGKVLYLYEDEEMTECEAVVELGGHDVVIFPEGLLDGELFARRNAICLKPKVKEGEKFMPSVTKDMKLGKEDIDAQMEQSGSSSKQQEKGREMLQEAENIMDATREDALNPSTPWFIFVRSNIEMEDWYFALIHASDHPGNTPSLSPLQPIFQPADMNHLVSTLDEQPDVIPTRWLNALMGRLFFSYYRTHTLEAYIIGRLMKKLSKVKRPTFLTDIVVTEVSVGNKAPTLSKPMLKELTKEGDAAMEVHFHYRGEFRITIEATATINLGTFKSYTVKLVLAAVLRELEGNLLIKVKRPPSNRIWYAFTQTPRMVLDVEPIVSDRQITWSMILSTIESRLKEIVQESVVMPNMDDIAFFDSLPHQHRGGIWQDACRHERKTTSLAEPTTDEVRSNDSTPIPDVIPPLDEISAASLISQPAEELTVTPPLSSSPLMPLSMPPAEPVNEEGPEPSRYRRRSWFSSVRSEGVNSFSRRESFASSEPDEDAQRGRSTEVDKNGTTAHRSQSTPNKPESIQIHNSDQEHDSDNSHPSGYLSPDTARRSSSQHSGHTKSTSVDSSSGAHDSTASTSSKKGTAASTPSSPNSFLSTLKSRAGDKQALSNTAKEAMRKWGVNWGGLRKDTGSGSSNDDISDHGSIGSTIGSRLRPDSNFNVAGKARASYAEVRAAVAERKGKDRNSHVMDEGVDLSRSSSPVAILIPDGSKGKTRTPSNPWSELAPPQATSSPSSYPDSLALSSSSTSSSRRLSTGETASAISKKQSIPSISRTNTEAEGQNDLDLQPAAPIVHVQPKAKTMTIPGIHASHRGDIMSMGYNAPPQPPSMVPSEGKSSIQSVYRLWKTPTSSGEQHNLEQSPLASLASQQSRSGESSSSEREDRDAVPRTLPPNAHLSSSPPLPPRPVPPPLPPRSTPIPAVTRPAVDPSIQSSPPSASQTLKSIATKDERTRAASLENGVSSMPPRATFVGVESESRVSAPDHSHLAETSPSKTIPSSTSTVTNPGPPLPPRRIQTTA